MENEPIASEKTQEPTSEQLLKLLEMQVAAARQRRSMQEGGHRKAGVIGLLAIVGGAAIALWLMLSVLEQMRPSHGGRVGSANGNTAESTR